MSTDGGYLAPPTVSVMEEQCIFSVLFPKDPLRPFYSCPPIWHASISRLYFILKINRKVNMKKEEDGLTTL